MRKTVRFALSVAFIVTTSFPFVHSDPLVLKGGTIIDVSNYGRSLEDIEDGVILIEDGLIVAVGNAKTFAIPDGIRVIDMTGKYVLPGLIDGYAALDNQSFANAYLYLGVTSIVGCYGYRRSPLYTSADPCPNIFLYGDVGHFDISTEEMLKRIEEHAEEGVRFLNVMYALTPEQVRLAIEKAHELGMPTIGEFAKFSYREAIEYGLDAILHFSRYAIELAPPEMRRAVAEQPHGPAAGEFRKWLMGLDPEEKIVQEYADVLGSSGIGLIPTFSIGCLDAPFISNPWNQPIAGILNPQDIHNPVDAVTGKHYTAQQLEFVGRWVDNILKIEGQYYQAGARYLAGSGCDINGTLPGISLHDELLLLTKVGLSEREAIAAATSNFAEIFGWNEVGRIKPGCRADVLVVEKNPLEDIKNLKAVDTVLLAGEIVDRKALLTPEPGNHTTHTRELEPGTRMSPQAQETREGERKPPGLGNPEVHQLTENVYAITGLYHPAGEEAGVTAGIIFTPQSVIFIDAGSTIASAEYIWNIAREKIKGGEKLYLILSHHHSDHIFGMHVFREKGVTVIAHDGVQTFMSNRGMHYKDFLLNRLGWDAKKGDEIFGRVVLSEPDRIIENDTILTVDGEEIHLLYTPGHVPTELSVYHPNSKVLFAGDTVYEGMDLTTHFGGPSEWKEWIAQLERLKQLQIEVIIPGHGCLCGQEELDRNIAYLEGLF